MSTDFVDTDGLGYAYPNSHAYRGLSWYGGKTLSKGILYALNPTDGTSNTKVFKRFQFNPPTISMSISMVAVDTQSSTQTGGAVPSSANGVGNLSVSWELFFNREIEVTRATNRAPTGGAITAAAADVFRKIGVQKDIYDVLRVILAGTDDGVTDIALPTTMDMPSITKRVYDLSSDGKMLANKPVVVVFGSAVADSSALGFYGFVNSFNVVYDKFNHNLVPVQARISLGLDVLQQRPSSTLTSLASGTTTTSGSQNPGLNLPDPNGGSNVITLVGVSGTVTPGGDQGPRR